jgi:cytochrome c oxidase assembly factor CtaG
VAVVDPWQLQADPEWAVAIVVVAVDYALVVRTFERRGSPTPARQRACFAAGLALIAVGLLSPLEHIALTSLLSAHLLQNVILADWAPPLLVLGLTPAMMAAAERRAWVRAATSPPVALTLWLAAWYALHVPAVYGYALEHRWALGLEHLAFLGSGLAFWWAVVSPGRMRAQARLLFLFGAFIAAAPVAFALAFAHPLYDFYEHAPKLWGLSPLEDQQIGAIAMAIEQATILFAACSIAFMQWLDEDDAPPRPVGFPR